MSLMSFVFLLVVSAALEKCDEVGAVWQLARPYFISGKVVVTSLTLK